MAMFTDPVKNLKALGLAEDAVVADLGAGSGFYSIPLAGLVPNGRVYAIEVQKDFLATVRNKAKEARLENLECILGDVEKIGGTKLADGVADAAVASDVFFQLEEKDKFAEEAKRILKPGGKVLLVDWSPDSPLSLFPKERAIPKSRAREIFESKGLVFTREIDAGAHHYGMIFQNELSAK